MREHLACLILALLAAGCDRPQGPPAVRIEIDAAQQGEWRIVYELSAPVDELALGPSLNGLRAENWRLTSSQLHLDSKDGNDRVIGRGFTRVEFLAPPDAPPLPKDYQAFARAGDRGVLIYTGHFMPRDAEGRLALAPLTIRAPAGWHVVAPDAAGEGLKDWRSPFNAPAFIYVGPDAPLNAAALTALVDPETPDWISALSEDLAPRLFAALADAFRAAPAAPPMLFLTAGDLSAPGQISFRGDSAAWQFQMTLDGGAWLADEPRARAVFEMGLAHEAAHLWQTVEPLPKGAPAWIHEGGAEAVALETLLALGLWDDAAASAHLADAVRDCDGARGRTLAAVQAAGEWRTVYACGLLINRAAAGPDGVAAFWREFLAAATREGGYDAALFFTVAAGHVGEDRAAGLQRMTESKLAKPGGTFAAAGPTLP